MSNRKPKRVHRRAAVNGKTKPAAQAQAVQPQMAYLRHWVGMPVCAVLKDGTILYGTLSSIDKEELMLHGIEGQRKISRSSAPAKAQVAALGGLGQMFGGLGGGGAAGAASGGGLGSMFGGLFGGGAGGSGGGLFGNLGNWFRIGMGVVQFVFPLLKGFGF